MRREQFSDGVIVGHKQSKSLNRILETVMSRYKMILYNIEVTSGLGGLTAVEIKKRLASDSCTQVMEKEEKGTNLSDYFQIFSSRIKKRSTLESYEYTLRKIAAYTDIEHLSITDINVSFLKDFDSWMTDTCSVNTRSIHMRNLRAILNGAIDEGLMSSDRYPFRKFRIRSEQTAKRSMTVEEFKEFISYTCQEHQRKYRDIFVLSFLLAGINIVDLLRLPNQEKLDRIKYRRSKTGIPTEVIVVPAAQEIIRRYRGNELLLCFGERYQNHKDFLHRMNENLQEIGPVESIERRRRGKIIIETRKMPLQPHLTSYFARHSWASFAADIDIPDAIIDMALAHKSPYPMSDIYIRRNMRKIDDAVIAVAQYVGLL